MELTIANPNPVFVSPLSVEAALSALSGRADKAVLVAGGTWVMRAPLRGEASDRVFISLAKIPELHQIVIDQDFMHLGALATYQVIADAVAPLPDLCALGQAAAQAANPAVRRMATVGGNICTRGLAAVDLVPALIALQATVDVQSTDGTSTVEVETYVQTRATRPGDEILTKVSIPRQRGISAHKRALLRQAGEYPVANLSASIDVDSTGLITSVRMAVAAVEALPKRWHSLENALQGQRFHPALSADVALSCTTEFAARDGIDAPGWYRLRLLPRLVETAFADMAAQLEKGV